MGQNYEYAIKTLKTWQNKFNFEFLKTVEDTCGGLLSLVNLQGVCCFYYFIQYLGSSFN